MLTHKVIVHVDLPHEPGQWIEARKPSLAILNEVGDGQAGVINMLQRCITAWSYDEPVSNEMIGELDADTATVVLNALNEAKPEGERKNSSGRSTKR